VIGSGLLVRSFEALRAIDPGFSADNLLTFTVQPLRTKYENAQAVALFYGRLIERLEAIPGVTRVGAVNTLPLVGGGCCNTTTVVEEFPPAEGELPPTFHTRRTTPGYFEAMNIPLVEGRAFTTVDHNGQLGSVIISRSVKDTYWPDTSALGKRITTFGIPTKEVVGVVGDVHVRGLDVGAEQSVYLPMLDPDGDTGMLSLTDPMTFTVRTAGEPLGIVSAIGSAIAELDPDLPMADVRTMDRILGDSMSRTSFTMSILLIAALIALFLGSVGIYGVLSYVTSQRIPEIGIRSALGASPGAVGRMVLTQGMKLAAIGLVIGFFGAIALGRVMVAELYEVSPFDSVTFVAASAIILGVAALASLLPAARAAGTSPVESAAIPVERENRRRMCARRTRASSCPLVRARGGVP
jgi:putative ABC transport system permease protein